jgi:hypothetical protein
MDNVFTLTDETALTYVQKITVREIYAVALIFISKETPRASNTRLFSATPFGFSSFKY